MKKTIICMVLLCALLLPACQSGKAPSSDQPSVSSSSEPDTVLLPSSSEPDTTLTPSSSEPDTTLTDSEPSEVSPELSKEQMLQLVPDKKDLPSEEVMDILWSYGGIAHTLETVYELAGNPQRVETRDMPICSDLTPMTVVPTQVYEYDTTSGIVYYICYDDDGRIIGLFKGDEWIAEFEKLWQGQS